MQTKFKLSRLVMNTGQIPGLPKNPREWASEDVERLAKSIQETPELLEARPLIVFQHGPKFIVLGGNLRFAALKKLKWKYAPCYLLPIDTPVEKMKEIVIKDNGSFGKWDYDMLANEWDDLDLSGWGVPAWNPDSFGGSSSGDGGASSSGRIEGKDDEYDVDQKVEKRVKRGEIWALGPHRLMCGDSTRPEDIAKLMNGEVSDLWLTDPPYNVDYEEKEQYKIDLGYAVSKHDVAIANDKMGNDEFLRFLTDAFAAAKQFIRPGGVFYIWHADTEGYNFRKALLDIKNMKVAETLIWAKDRLCFGRQDYHWQHEPCLYGWKEGAAHKWYSDRKQTTVMLFDRPRKSEEHPTMKPVPLFVYLIQNSSKEGDIVLDCFGGSGTTIIACEQTGRIGYAMELDEHYASVIVDRWEKFTGKKAVKL